MKMFTVPKWLHELFGRRTSLFELCFVLLFALGMSTALLVFTFEEWIQLAAWKIVLLALLLVDISGGVVANLTRSTNEYYRQQPRARIVFIAIHLQPVLLALLLADGLMTSLIVWLYTVAAAFIVNALIAHPAQRLIGLSLALLGCITLWLSFEPIANLLLLILSMYMIKVIYSFAVDHYSA